MAITASKNEKKSNAKFHRRAGRVHTELLELTRREHALTAEKAFRLLHVERRKLYRAFNRADTYDYAVHFGFVTSHRKARELVELAKRVEDWPEMRNKLMNGEVEWTKARDAAAGAALQPERRPYWLKAALTKRSNAIQTEVRELKGEPAPVRWPFQFTRDQAGDFEQALALIRAQYGRKLTDGEAAAILGRAWLAIQAGGGGDAARSADNPANRVVTYRCGDCSKAWRETRSGRVEVHAQELEAAGCDAELVDARDGPERITKTVPPMIRRHVLDRDGHRCRVPGCSSVGFLHIHHEPGREAVGHDPSRMCPLCDEHHRQRHLELLEIREDPDVGFRFFRAGDGVELTAAVGEVAPIPPAPAAEAARSREQRSPSIDDDARKALVNLGFGKREASHAVDAARATVTARGEDVSVEGLLRQALASLP